MVWEEPPGWHHIGNSAWRQLVVQNVHDMIVRDRNRPSVIVWATRLNETTGARALYARTRALASRLDGSRQTTGAMDKYSTAGWAEDVFAFDDYQKAGKKQAALRPPLRNLPYLVSESVGAIGGSPTYRWTDPGKVLAEQAVLHGAVHSVAAGNPRYAGLLGWCGIDYASLNGGNRIWRALKTPGVLDTFRIPKPGAAIYRSQLDPAARPVILPVFWWDFGPASPPCGPGPGTMIATNCDRLEIYAGDRHLATGTPDTCPPVFADLTVDGSSLPELRIEGYVRGRPAATVRMSADPALDCLELTAGDAAIEADGSDATGVTFRAVDAYGHHRPGVSGTVGLAVSGPAEVIGDNPFPFAACGGVGGALIRSLPGETGPVSVTVQHPVLGAASVHLMALPPAAGRRFW
jgi:beta-galactosidase